MLNTSHASTLAPAVSFFSAVRGSAKLNGRIRFALFTVLAVAGPLAACEHALGQQAAAPAPFSMAELRPALANVQNAITAANVARWKVPGDVRANTQQDVASMQRDLSATLPGLMTTAEASSTSLAPTFAVFRNVDALYDVLLRVTETAGIGAPAADANSLESARAALETGRAKLGAWLLQAITAQDARVAEAAAAANRPPPPVVPNKIVVEDGPENPKPRKKKAAAPPAPQ
jgi:hypothetical protein